MCLDTKWNNHVIGDVLSVEYLALYKRKIWSRNTELFLQKYASLIKHVTSNNCLFCKANIGWAFLCVNLCLIDCAQKSLIQDFNTAIVYWVHYKEQQLSILWDTLCIWGFWRWKGHFFHFIKAVEHVNRVVFRLWIAFIFSWVVHCGTNKNKNLIKMTCSFRVIEKDVYFYLLVYYFVTVFYYYVDRF